MYTPPRTPCNAPTKAGPPCQSAGTQPDGRCWPHSASTTAEMRSQAGRNGAAATNHRTSARRVERELKAALTAQEAATAALQPAEVALVGPVVSAPVLDATVGVDVSTEAACEGVISRALRGVLEGTLPPSRSKAVSELLKVRIELANLSISSRLLKLEQQLKDGKSGKPARRNLPRRTR